MMMQTMLQTGERLAEALSAENEALTILDLKRAATLASAKVQASDAFSAAYSAAMRTGLRAAGAEGGAVQALAEQLRDLTSENRRLLERAIGLQSKVIETLAGAAIPASRPATYAGNGFRAVPRQTPAMAVTARA
ncbi:hypothetical protein [Muricoccus radiodurans]|uniref:hypothetical protein n=1 Tax=Muricoccus radiodurans TaxID=2231721 RepID=UPI003CF265D8